MSHDEQEVSRSVWPGQKVVEVMRAKASVYDESAMVTNEQGKVLLSALFSLVASTSVWLDAGCRRLMRRSGVAVEYYLTWDNDKAKMVG